MHLPAAYLFSTSTCQPCPAEKNEEEMMASVVDDCVSTLWHGLCTAARGEGGSGVSDNTDFGSGRCWLPMY